MALAFTALWLAAAVFASLFFARASGHLELQALHAKGEALLRAIEPAVRERLLNNDIASLARYLDELRDTPGLAAVHVRDEQGTVLAEQRREAAGGGEASVGRRLARWLAGAQTPAPMLAVAIRHEGRAIGRLELVLSLRPVEEAVARALVNGASAALGLLGVIAAFGYWWLGRLTAPLKPLTDWAREFSRGNFAPRIRLPAAARSPELRSLAQAFADGSAALRHYIRTLEETRELLEHSEARLRKLVNGMHEILFELTPDARIAFLNPAWERLTGFKTEEAIGKPLTDFLLDEDMARDLAPERLPRLHEKNRETALRTADGRRLWVHLEAEAQHDASGRFTGVVGTLGDITKRVELNRLLARYQEELYTLSVTDSLTGLYNRRHFDTQLEVILADHLRQQRPVCLLLIDLDGFKFINDTYGHPFGDEVLRTTAALLRRCVRRNDYLARLAGDEFAMVLKNADLESAARIARKLHARINETRIQLPVGYMQLQASIGVAESPTHGRNAQELVSAADVALYHSKRRGRNRVEILSPDMSQAVMSIFSQGFQLRRALEAGQLRPAFQPIYDMQFGRPMAYEVLARLDLNGELVPAKDFITVAEELGLTRDIDLHVIRAALAHTPPEQALFLNVDLSSFHDREFVRSLTALLGPACAQGRRITIEITERETVPVSDTFESDIQALRALGCKLALDDFGSGYSTYNFLNRFRPDYLKIEGSFVRGMLTSESDRKIVAHIHELARAFGVETIAECVENAATEQALREIGIRNAQGLYFGAPHLVS
jgi:diguanylate cyclase (GGDEF)-like protein/PAS domain S-box-containing protein